MNSSGRATLLEMKYARIIKKIALSLNVDEAAAMDIFYTSELMPLIDDGTADLFCRSDDYLAGEIISMMKNSEGR